MFNEHKLKELVVYIANKSKDDPAFGKTKLLKLLAYADFAAYRRLGHSITGATYIKLEHGPSSREAPGALNMLRALKRIEIVEEDVFGYSQTRIVALDKPDAKALDSHERAVIDDVIETFSRFNNSQMADVSHRDFVGWKLADEFDEIPYSTVFLVPPEMLPDPDPAHIADLLRQSAEARGVAEREVALAAS